MDKKSTFEMAQLFASTIKNSRIFLFINLYFNEFYIENI